ncbi:branched-chain amino acid ABC transporter permease, partial [Rhizobiaceae sp. 2RAB30]
MKNHIATVAILAGLVVLAVLITEAVGIRLYDRVATNLCISLVLVLGLQVFMGNSGILSFAHMGFMGVGAYASAVLTIPAQMKGMALPDLYPFLQGVVLSPYIAILIGGVLAALVAAILSYPLMRLSDAAAVITSFALLVVLYTVMTHWSALTNGPRTLFGLPKATDLRLAALVAVLAVIAALAFKESRAGKLLR